MVNIEAHIYGPNTDSFSNLAHGRPPIVGLISERRNTGA
jgi:hypothetical protein